MKYRLKYLSKTVEDREVIKNYLSQFYSGTEKRFFTLLKKKITLLKEFPLSCPIYEDNPKYRKLIVGDYLVFYTVDENMKLIEVRRIIHGSQNICDRVEHY